MPKIYKRIVGALRGGECNDLWAREFKSKFDKSREESRKVFKILITSLNVGMKMGLFFFLT